MNRGGPLPRWFQRWNRPFTTSSVPQQATRYTAAGRDRAKNWRKYQSKKSLKRKRKALERFRQQNPPPPGDPAPIPQRSPQEWDEMERRHQLVADVIRTEQEPPPRQHEVLAREDPEEIAAAITAGEVLASPGNLTYLLRVHAARGDFESAVETLVWMRELGVRPTIATFTSLIHACAQQRNPMAAEEIFRHLREEEGLEPTSVTYGALMQAHVRGGDLAGAFRVLADAERDGVQPDTTMFTHLIVGCVHHGDVERAHAVFDHMRTFHSQPDVVAFTAMINACAKQDKVEYAVNLFDEIKYLGMMPTHVTYGAIIHATGRSLRHHELAHTYFTEMQGAGYKRDRQAFQGVLLACSHKGETNRAKEYMRLLKQEQLTPDTSTFNALLTVYARAVTALFRERKRLAERDPDVARLDAVDGRDLLKIDAEESRPAWEKREPQHGKFILPGTQAEKELLAERMLAWYYDKNAHVNKPSPEQERIQDGSDSAFASTDTEEQTMTYQELLADPDHQQFRSELRTQGVSEGHLLDLEWEMLNGRPDTDTDNPDPVVRDVLDRRAKRERTRAQAEMLERLVMGRSPISEKERARRQLNRQRKEEGVAGYSDATTSDGERSVQSLERVAATSLGWGDGQVPSQTTDAFWAQFREWTRKAEQEQFHMALQQIQRGKLRPLDDSEFSLREWQRAADALVRFRGNQEMVTAAGSASDSDRGSEVSSSVGQLQQLSDKEGDDEAMSSAAASRTAALDRVEDWLDEDRRVARAEAWASDAESEGGGADIAEFGAKTPLDRDPEDPTAIGTAAGGPIRSFADGTIHYQLPFAESLLDDRELDLDRLGSPAVEGGDHRGRGDHTLPDSLADAKAFARDIELEGHSKVPFESRERTPEERAEWDALRMIQEHNHSATAASETTKATTAATQQGASSSATSLTAENEAYPATLASLAESNDGAAKAIAREKDPRAVASALDAMQAQWTEESVRQLENLVDAADSEGGLDKTSRSGLRTIARMIRDWREADESGREQLRHRGFDVHPRGTASTPSVVRDSAVASDPELSTIATELVGDSASEARPQRLRRRALIRRLGFDPTKTEQVPESLLPDIDAYLEEADRLMDESEDPDEFFDRVYINGRPLQEFIGGEDPELDEFIGQAQQDRIRDIDAQDHAMEQNMDDRFNLALAAMMPSVDELGPEEGAATSAATLASAMRTGGVSDPEYADPAMSAGSASDEDSGRRSVSPRFPGPPSNRVLASVAGAQQPSLSHRDLRSLQLPPMDQPLTAENEAAIQQLQADVLGQGARKVEAELGLERGQIMDRDAVAEASWRQFSAMSERDHLEALPKVPASLAHEFAVSDDDVGGDGERKFDIDVPPPLQSLSPSESTDAASVVGATPPPPPPPPSSGETLAGSSGAPDELPDLQPTDSPPYAGYDPTHVVDTRGVVWEAVAGSGQVGPPGLVRRRRSGRPSPWQAFAPRPASLTRAGRESPGHVQRLDPATREEAQAALERDRERLRAIWEATGSQEGHDDDDAAEDGEGYGDKDDRMPGMDNDLAHDANDVPRDGAMQGHVKVASDEVDRDAAVERSIQRGQATLERMLRGEEVPRSPVDAAEAFAQQEVNVNAHRNRVSQERGKDGENNEQEDERAGFEDPELSRIQRIEGKIATRIDRADEAGPVEDALVRATDSLERHRKRRIEGHRRTLLDALFAVQRMERGSLDMSHLFEDASTTIGTARNGDGTFDQTRLLHWALGEGWQHDPEAVSALESLWGAESARQAMHVPEGSVSLSAETGKRIAEAAGVSWEDMQRGTAFGDGATTSALLQQGSQAQILSRHGERVKRAREELGELARPGQPGEVRLRALQGMAQRLLSGLEWGPTELPDDHEEAVDILLEEMSKMYHRAMRDEGVQPDGFTLNIMVLGFADALRPAEAYDFISTEFPRIGHTPDERTFRALIRMHMRLRRMDHAQALLETMEAHGIAPSKDCFGLLVHGYAREYQIANAIDVLRDMKERGLECPEKWAFLLRQRCKELEIYHPLVPEHPAAWQFRPEVMKKRLARGKHINKGMQMIRPKIHGQRFRG